MPFFLGLITVFTFVTMFMSMHISVLIVRWMTLWKENEARRHQD